MSKVLVVEDDKFLSSAYKVKLTKSGFEVQMAGDGQEAIELLQNFRPDIILLDLVMPRKDGFTTLAEIKQHPQLKNIPVIVTSNLGQKEDLDKAMGLGALDYIIKSDLSMDTLVAKINEVIKASTA
jgi:two-component system, OmpR family, alkaline phosphatase synthesis response regulator PhoP